MLSWFPFPSILGHPLVSSISSTPGLHLASDLLHRASIISQNYVEPLPLISRAMPRARALAGTSTPEAAEASPLSTSLEKGSPLLARWERSIWSCSSHWHFGSVSNRRLPAFYGHNGRISSGIVPSMMAGSQLARTGLRARLIRHAPVSPGD